MSRAFKCDHCDVVKEGTPAQIVAWGPTDDAAASHVEYDTERAKDLCADCWPKLLAWFDGDYEAAVGHPLPDPEGSGR